MWRHTKALEIEYIHVVMILLKEPLTLVAWRLNIHMWRNSNPINKHFFSLLYEKGLDP
jgi:hypothetical protein